MINSPLFSGFNVRPMNFIGLTDFITGKVERFTVGVI